MLRRTSPAWYELDLKDPSAEIQAQLDIVSQIPGIKLYPKACHIPITATMVPEVIELLELFGEKTLPDGRGYQFSAIGGLYPHQVVAAQAIFKQRTFLLADDMGLGKSRAAAVAVDQLRKQFNSDLPIVIVGPQFVRDVWKHELEALGFVRKPEDFYAFKGTDIKKPWPKSTPWLFCHYQIAKEWWQQIHSVKPIATILDEAHWCKNPKSNRAQGALLIAAPRSVRVLLTGTPLDNAPEDLWNLLTITCGPVTWGSQIDFRKRYMGATFNGYGYEDQSPTNVEELKARMAPFYLRRTIEQTGFVLPKFTRLLQLVELEKPTSGLTATQMEQLVRALARNAVGEDTLQVFNKLRKATSSAKIPATVEYLKNLLEQDEQAVVFCWEKATANKIASKVNGVCITGELDQDQRTAEIKKFQAGTTRIITATYSVLKEGVTLTASRFVVLHDLDYKLTTVLQSEKRVHRISQTRPVQSIWMVADGSFDRMLATLLLRKADVLSKMLDVGNDLAELNLEEALGVEGLESQVKSMMELWEKCY